MKKDYDNNKGALWLCVVKLKSKQSQQLMRGEKNVVGCWWVYEIKKSNPCEAWKRLKAESGLVKSFTFDWLRE